MSPKPVIDAGPALNFLAINQERLLIGVLGRISTPETVEDEVLGKAKTDHRFKRVGSVWSKLTPKWVEVLPDEQTDTLEAVCARQSGMPWAERKKQAKDLGELMVVAHAVAAAEQGSEVTVVIDDQSGARMATAEAQRLDRLRAQQSPVGRIILVNTIIILERAVGSHVPDRAAMRAIYSKLRECDDGLLPIKRTRLLSAELWEQPELK